MNKRTKHRLIGLAVSAAVLTILLCCGDILLPSLFIGLVLYVLVTGLFSMRRDADHFWKELESIENEMKTVTTREDLKTLWDRAQSLTASHHVMSSELNRVIALLQERHKTLYRKLSDEEIIQASVNYRHDFGLLSQEEQKRITFACQEWHLAISKALKNA
jgi:hypothetical protein